MAFLFSQFVHARLGNRVQLGLDRLKKLQSLGRDAGDGLPLVIPATRASYQAPRLQAVHEARDIGGALDHSAGDLAARMAFGMHASQDSQHVVLRTG